jgi:type IV pilus assembly protein PilM
MNYLLKFLKDKPLIALDIGTSSIKLIQLKRTRGKYELVNFGIIPIPSWAITEDRIVEPEIVSEAIKNLVTSEKIKTKYVALAISGSSVVIKKIVVPLMSEAELAESIYGEVEQYIPYNIEEVNIDFYILPQEQEDTEEMQVIFVAVKNEQVLEYSDIIEKAGLKPAVIDVDVFAIENSYEFNYGIAPGVVGLVDIGANITNINILEDGLTSFTRDLPFGGVHFNKAIEQQLNVSSDEAEQIKLGVERKNISPKEVVSILTSVLDELAFLINESLEFFQSSGSEKVVSKLILSGGCAKLAGIDQFLSNKLHCTVEISNPFKNIKIDEKVFDPEYINAMSPLAAVGVGLALRSPIDKF